MATTEQYTVVVEEPLVTVAPAPGTCMIQPGRGYRDPARRVCVDQNGSDGWTDRGLMVLETADQSNQEMSTLLADWRWTQHAGFEKNTRGPDGSVYPPAWPERIRLPGYSAETSTGWVPGHSSNPLQHPWYHELDHRDRFARGRMLEDPATPALAHERWARGRRPSSVTSPDQRTVREEEERRVKQALLAVAVVGGAVVLIRLLN